MYSFVFIKNQEVKMTAKDEKRKKINEYRKSNQISFVIPKNDDDFRDKLKFIKTYDSGKTHKDIYKKGLDALYNEMKGNPTPLDFKIKELEAIIDSKEKELSKDKIQLDDYRKQKNEIKKEKDFRKEKNFVNELQKDYTSYKRKHPDKHIRDFVKTYYRTIDNRYVKSNYHNKNLDDHQICFDEDDRINEYVKIFMKHLS